MSKISATLLSDGRAWPYIIACFCYFIWSIEIIIFIRRIKGRYQRKNISNKTKKAKTIMPHNRPISSRPYIHWRNRNPILQLVESEPRDRFNKQILRVTCHLVISLFTAPAVSTFVGKLGGASLHPMGRCDALFGIQRKQFGKTFLSSKWMKTRTSEHGTLLKSAKNSKRFW